MDADRLRSELVRRQGRLSGREFARLLGISESYWSLIRRGERPLTAAVAKRAVEHFPDLAYLVEAEPHQEQVEGLRARAFSSGRGQWRWLPMRIVVNASLAVLVASAVVVAQIQPWSGDGGAIYAAESTTNTSTKSSKPQKSTKQQQDSDDNVDDDDEARTSEAKTPPTSCKTGKTLVIVKGKTKCKKVKVPK